MDIFRAIDLDKDVKRFYGIDCDSQSTNDDGNTIQEQQPSSHQPNNFIN
jgi:hypothetical protein